MDEPAMTSGAAAPASVEPAAPPRPEVALEVEQVVTVEGSKEGASLRRPRRKSENPWRVEMLSRLEKPGCLLCREAEADLRRYYFWFLLEQYANVPTMDRMERAHGFCLRHTRHLLEREAPDQTSYVAGYVLRFCADRLRSLRAVLTEGRYDPRVGRQPESLRFRPRVGCPACEDERVSTQTYAQAIVGCLGGEEDVVTAFRASDGLCVPHFLETARAAGWETLQCMAEEEIRRLEGARAHLSASRASGTDGAMADALREAVGRLYGPDLDGRIRPFLVAGREPSQPRGASAEHRAAAEAGTSAPWSPAFEETCRLLRLPGCCFCRVSAHGREEYLAWLEREIRDFTHDGRRWSQALFLCGPHAWLFADRSAPEVLATAADHFLDYMTAVLRELLWEIREPIPPSLFGRVRALPARWRQSGQRESRTHSRPPLSQRARSTLRTLWLTPQRLLNGVRNQSLRWDRCPLCHHLETIEDRAADRLLAVLSDPDGRRVFERSYGLCLRHAPLVLDRAGDPSLGRDVAAVLLARIELDLWEAEEYLRKQSWSVRHEPKGAEGEAWLRASTRIAGVAMEQQYGF